MTRIKYRLLLLAVLLLLGPSGSQGLKGEMKQKGVRRRALKNDSSGDRGKTKNSADELDEAPSTDEEMIQHNTTSEDSLEEVQVAAPKGSIQAEDSEEEDAPIGDLDEEVELEDSMDEAVVQRPSSGEDQTPPKKAKKSHKSKTGAKLAKSYERKSKRGHNLSSKLEATPALSEDEMLPPGVSGDEIVSPTQSPQTDAPATEPPVEVTDAPETDPPVEVTDAPETDPPATDRPVEITEAPATDQPLSTEAPTDAPTVPPTAAPTETPTNAPTNSLSEAPTTLAPTDPPATDPPTSSPTSATAPTDPDGLPSQPDGSTGTPAPTETAVATTDAPTGLTCPTAIQVTGTLEYNFVFADREPTEAEIESVVDATLSFFVDLLREEYGDSVVEISGNLVSSDFDFGPPPIYTVTFEAVVPFSDCAPPLDEVNELLDLSDSQYEEYLTEYVFPIEPAGQHIFVLAARVEFEGSASYAEAP